MALTLGDNFSYGGSKPLDARLTYATLADMKTVADSTMYNGCLAYCVATDKTYQWKSSNTVDADTGKWREFTTGSSIEVDDEIDEESTNPVQNAVIAEALDTKQDAADKMTASDMDDVVTPLPSVMSRRFKYSTEEQVIGEWIDGKPLYQKTVDNMEMPQYSSGSPARTNYSVTSLGMNAVDKIIDYHFSVNDGTSSAGLHESAVYASSDVTLLCCGFFWNKTEFSVCSKSNVLNTWKWRMTVQYTKTTD